MGEIGGSNRKQAAKRDKGDRGRHTQHPRVALVYEVSVLLCRVKNIVVVSSWNEGALSGISAV